MTKDEAPTSPKDAALTLALEALQAHGTAYLHHELRYEEAITAIKEALAQPEEQQSCDKQGTSSKMQDIVCPNCGDMARTWPKQKRLWVSLTREEINSALSKYQNWYDFAAHLENILKEKNK